MYKEDVKIPKERLAVLIGKKGESKKRLEKLTKTRLMIDSNEGDVTITGDESLNVYNSATIVKAIGRGFNPDIALTLLNEENLFEVIDITKYSGKSANKLSRLKGRCIGNRGKTRRVIEQLSNTSISIYGKTVCIIGKVENVIAARRSIESLLKGSRHASAYKKLEDFRSA